jgi:hypothetical protein
MWSDIGDPFAVGQCAFRPAAYPARAGFRPEQTFGELRCPATPHALTREIRSSSRAAQIRGTAIPLQVAASAAGNAVLPAGLGLAIGAAGARVLGPSLLVLGLAMAALFLIRRPGRVASPVSP